MSFFPIKYYDLDIMGGGALYEIAGTSVNFYDKKLPPLPVNLSVDEPQRAAFLQHWIIKKRRFDSCVVDGIRLDIDGKNIFIAVTVENRFTWLKKVFTKKQIEHDDTRVFKEFIKTIDKAQQKYFFLRYSIHINPLSLFHDKPIKQNINLEAENG